ncbi:MAG TPA: DUF4280 domain-containing protein [Opitutaceae bacterium]|jgi:hypothetical protein|nr:DUF4280 domain-containing protein [Opitutaceae bacterium]
MPFQVISTAKTQCSFGAAPGTLMVLPVNLDFCNQQPAANIMDHVPMVNIMPHGMCMSLANPAVAAATAAALGVLTPQPCIPVTPSPWTPGAMQTFIANQKALDDTCICNCNWAGIIKIAYAGQTNTFID